MLIYKKMEIYKDYELNRIANEIRDEIEEYGQLMSAMGDALRGAPTKIDPTRAQQIFTQIHETPTSFANDIFSRNQRKLMQIKNHVGMHDEDYRELSEALAINIIRILLFPLNSASVASMTSDFKSNLNDPEVIKMKRNISEAASILINLYQLDISPDIKNQINHLQSDIKKVEKRFNPSSGCFIATHVYGEYEAPEVIKLRLF